MTKLEHYWLSNKEWYRFEGFKRVIKEDAPEAAKESYKKYLAQLKTKRRAI